MAKSKSEQSKNNKAKKPSKQKDSKPKDSKQKSTKSKSTKPKKSSKKSNKTTMLIVLSILAIILTIISLFVWSYYQDVMNVASVSTVYDQVYINDVNVGGMTEEEVEQALSEVYLEPLLQQQITLTSGDKTMTYTFADFGVSLDFEEAIDTAFKYGRKGTNQENYETVTNTLEPVMLEADMPLTYEKEKIDQILLELEDYVKVEPKDSTMYKENGAFVVTPSEVGYELDKEKTARDIEKALQNGESATIEVTLNEIEPQYTEEIFYESQDLIGSCSTDLSSGTSDRTKNVTNAASKINNDVVLPGETYSVNAHIEPYTSENGYYPANIIVEGAYVQDYGGGVCQVSTTAYNAALQAEVEIVQRNNHSLQVNYIEPGFDAAIAGTYKDFVFKNDTGYPILIVSYVADNRLYVEFYGHEIHDESHSVEYYSVLIEEIPAPPDEITYDPSLPEGETVVDVPAHDGSIYETHKVTYEDGVAVSDVVIDSSYYVESGAEVRVGTGPPAVEPEAVPEQTSGGATEVAQ